MTDISDYEERATVWARTIADKEERQRWLDFYAIWFRSAEAERFYTRLGELEDAGCVARITNNGKLERTIWLTESFKPLQ